MNTQQQLIFDTYAYYTYSAGKTITFSNEKIKILADDQHKLNPNNTLVGKIVYFILNLPAAFFTLTFQVPLYCTKTIFSLVSCRADKKFNFKKNFFTIIRHMQCLTGRIAYIFNKQVGMRHINRSHCHISFYSACARFYHDKSKLKSYKPTPTVISTPFIVPQDLEGDTSKAGQFILKILQTNHKNLSTKIHTQQTLTKWACELLDLPANTSNAEILKAFTRKTPLIHSDKTGDKKNLESYKNGWAIFTNLRDKFKASSLYKHFSHSENYKPKYTEAPGEFTFEEFVRQGFFPMGIDEKDPNLNFILRILITNFVNLPIKVHSQQTLTKWACQLLDLQEDTPHAEILRRLFLFCL